MYDAQHSSRPSVPLFLTFGRPRSRASQFLLATGLLLASAGAVRVIGQGASAQGPTVWDGVYTEAQAARAASAFSQSCSSCHTLASQGEGPLTGEKFWEGYSQRSVGDLLTYVSTNMPNGNGASLPSSTYNDLVALILKANGFPAGSLELVPEHAANVQIVPKDGPGALPANTLVRVVGCLARNGREWVLTSATAPERTEKTGVSPEDASRPLGDRTMALKFVLTRLDTFVGQRMSVTGLLLGAGGVDGLNVSTANRVAEACP